MKDNVGMESEYSQEWLVNFETIDIVDLNGRLYKAYQSDSIVKKLVELKQNG